MPSLRQVWAAAADRCEIRELRTAFSSLICQAMRCRLMRRSPNVCFRNAPMAVEVAGMVRMRNDRTRWLPASPLSGGKYRERTCARPAFNPSQKPGMFACDHLIDEFSRLRWMNGRGCVSGWQSIEAALSSRPLTAHRQGQEYRHTGFSVEQRSAARAGWHQPAAPCTVGHRSKKRMPSSSRR